MKDSSARLVNAYWANMFGCSVADLRPAHGLAFVHAGFDGYDGVYAMMFGEAAPIVSVGSELLPRAQELARSWKPGTIRHAPQIAAILGDRADRVIGPAALLYADAETLRTIPGLDDVRQLSYESESDRALVASVRNACTESEWETGGSDFERDVVFGAFVGTSLAAIAGYEVWGNHIAHLAIVTHPDWRGRGLAKSAVLGASQHALSQQLVLQYRSLESNTASLRIAHALGFLPFATSLAARSRAQNV